MKQSKYKSIKPDTEGNCRYSEQDNETWQILYNRQIDIVQNRACDAFLKGLDILKFPVDRIPQCNEISARLFATTGWTVAPVPALISSTRFFSLLANKKFPAATFIRSKEELDYLQEPDIFHELFGHCPLLTNPNYAAFVEHYGQLSLKVRPQQQNRLLRLFWHTIEFGLINSANGLRIYGGGILSSKEETLYALESSAPQRVAFSMLDALRTPYRIDIKQPIYFILPSLEELYKILHSDIMRFVDQAIKLGDFSPLFEPAEEKKE